MISRSRVLVLMTVLAAGPLAAQQTRINLRLAKGQPDKFVMALCNLNLSNSKVEKGRSLLKKAVESKAPADRTTALGDSKMNLLNAIAQEGQDKNAAAWYYLARVALMEGDPAGADSAFTKAQGLAPDCELDITQYRQVSGHLLFTAADEMSRHEQPDSALVLFRDVLLLYRGWPQVYTNMGVVFSGIGHEDSAAVYFAKSLQISEKDTSMVDDRNAVALYLAGMYTRLNKNGEAIALLHKYLSWKPYDTEAQRTLALAFRNAGMPDSADALEMAMITRFSKQNLDSLPSQDLMSVGAVAFNNKRYADAEIAFAKAVKRNPVAREARYDLANTYLAMATQARDSADTLRKLAKTIKNPSDALKAQLADTTKLDAVALRANTELVAEATKLLEMEPMSEDELRLLAQGQRLLGQTDAVLKTATRLVALPFGVEQTLFQVSASGAEFAADATGRAPQDPAGKPIKTAPVTLVFEFFDANGAVGDSKETIVPVLSIGQVHSIQLNPKGAGIVGWRYRIKP